MKNCGVFQVFCHSIVIPTLGYKNVAVFDREFCFIWLFGYLFISRVLHFKKKRNKLEIIDFIKFHLK